MSSSHVYIFMLLFLQEAVFLSCGDNLRSKGMTYLTNSLFDYRSPENNGVKAEFILESTNHKVTIKSSYELPEYSRLNNLYVQKTLS